jgi:hypothetical protein
LYSYFNHWTEASVLKRATEWTMTLLYASRRIWDLARDTGRQSLGYSYIRVFSCTWVGFGLYTCQPKELHSSL